MGNGWIALHRQLQENPIWTCNEPFDSRSAWIDMLLSANHEDKEFYINGEFRMIKRGQFHTSQTKLAERWHWKRDRIEKYIKNLKKAKMIDYVSSKSGASRGTTITIVNYSVFQNIATSLPTSNGTSNQHQQGHQTNITSDINNKLNNDNNDNNVNNKKSGRFAPPTLQEVIDYCIERKNNISPQKFINYYESNGWHVGKNHMKDWKAAVRTWEQRDKEEAEQNKQKPKNQSLTFMQREYTDDDIKALERRKLGLT